MTRVSVSLRVSVSKSLNVSVNVSQNEWEHKNLSVYFYFAHIVTSVSWDIMVFFMAKFYSESERERIS